MTSNVMYGGLERLAGKWTDRLVVINKEDLRSARSRSIIPPGKMVLIPGVGIDLHAYQPSGDSGLRASVRSELGIPVEAPFLLIVAGINEEKRHGDVISALTLMQHQDAHLGLAGDGPLEADMRLQVENCL